MEGVFIHVHIFNSDSSRAVRGRGDSRTHRGTRPATRSAAAAAAAAVKREVVHTSTTLQFYLNLLVLSVCFVSVLFYT